MANEVEWSDAVWKGINECVLKEVGRVRVAQKVFATSLLDNNASEVPNEVINFEKFRIKEGQTKPLVEIYREFSLTSTQVKKESEQKIAGTLARMVAKELALTEDAYFFQARGRGNKDGVLKGRSTIDNRREDGDLGLLAEADEEIAIKRSDAGNAKYGENTFAAVADGIARLVSKGQGPGYALFLPTAIYSDTFVPPSDASLVTTADRIRPLVEGGFYSSGVLPADEGLLVALAGEPVKLYVGREATTEFVRKEGGDYVFRVVERVQYVVRDNRALVALRFLDATAPPTGKK